MLWSPFRRVCMIAFLLLFGIMGISRAQAQPRVSLDLHNADVRKALSTIAEAGGLNVVVGPDVTGTVTLRLRDVPVEEALQVVLKTVGLVPVRHGQIIGIVSRKTWLRQQRQQAELLTLGLAPTRIAIIPLAYAKADELAPLLATLLSPWGTVAVDERTNSLIIRDIPESPLFQSNSDLR
ncbi:MAG TPA: secretin N-terminal domain-containing protein [Alphaproteobacteria bacterium]|nr:secretin N-terminal domain-containing protein [Alphaproteobacteria bacterium]